MPRKCLRKTIGILVALGSAALVVGADSGSAKAAMLGLNDSVSVNWLLPAGDTDQNGNTNPYSQDITVEAIFEVTSFDQSAGKVDLWVSLSNTTADEGNEVGVYKLGLGVDPTLTGVGGLVDGSTSDTDAFESIELGTSPELVNSGMIDLLAKTDKPGHPWRLQEGQTDIFSFTMFFDPASLGSTIDLDPFDIKILANPASFQLTTSTNGRIPVPASLWLLGAGLIGLGLVGRRLRRQ